MARLVRVVDGRNGKFNTFIGHRSHVRFGDAARLQQNDLALGFAQPAALIPIKASVLV